jgi:hypothetical protein
VASLVVHDIVGIEIGVMRRAGDQSQFVDRSGTKRPHDAGLASP